MSKTIVITGASTGIGKETAIYFARKGWNVAATMRKPNATEWRNYKNVKVYALDVLDNEAIINVAAKIIEDFIKIDVIVNNAGYGLIGCFENATREQILRQFNTNVFGLMDVTRAFLPHFREHKSGTIINVASVAGRTTFPLYSLYHSTKWAVEGFSESLSYELRQFRIRVKIIEPGPIKTDFYERSQDLIKAKNGSEYYSYTKRVYPFLQKAGLGAVGPRVVAKKIFKAANDSSNKIRYPIGGGASALLFLRRLIGDRLFIRIVRIVSGA